MIVHGQRNTIVHVTATVGFGMQDQGKWSGWVSRRHVARFEPTFRSIDVDFRHAFPITLFRRRLISGERLFSKYN